MAVSSEPLTVGDALQQQLREHANAHEKARSKLYDIFLFTAYGLLNNGIICVAYGAAQDIVGIYGYPNSAPLVTLISTVSAIVAPLMLLSWPLRFTGYRVRSIVSGLIGLVGLLMLAFSTYAMKSSAAGMVVGMTAVFLLGLQQAFGENCACMRFRRFSKHALSCWGAGTGLAGIFPPMAYGAIKSLPLYMRFLVAIPLLGVLFGLNLMVYNAGRGAKERDTSAEIRIVSTIEEAEHGQVAVTVPASETETRNLTTIGAHDEPTDCFAWYVIAVFSGVYALEYFIFPTLVDRATKCKPTSPLGDQAYNNSWIAYNIGVTISRGSIAFFEFPCIWLVFVLQAINVAGWAIEVETHFVQSMRATGYIIQYAWMVWVGLMGGTAYANCIRRFHTSPRIPDKKRDQLVNLAFAVSMAAMMASTGLGELLENTILTTKIVTRNCPSP